MTYATTVGWDDDPAVAARAALPALDAHVTADACVIGLGGSGLTAIEELTGRGLRVVGLDAGRVGAGAAGRNGGFLLGGASPFLHEAIDLWGQSAVDLYRATLRELDALFDLLGPSVIARSGSLRLVGIPGAPESEVEAADRDLERRDCAAHARALDANGIAFETYGGELGEGLFLPDDASMNPAKRVLSLAAQLSPLATLYERSPVTAVQNRRVETARGSVEADVIIVAVDGRLEQILPALAGRVRTARLQMLSTEPSEPGRLPCPAYGRWGYDFAQQDIDGRFFVGGGRDAYFDEEWTMETSPTEHVQGAIENVSRRMAGKDLVVDRRWGASVSYTEDRRAICAAVDEGIYACGAYSGTGNLVGPVAARALVALALDGAQPPDYFSS